MALLAAAEEAQAARHVGDPWDEPILKWLAKRKDPDADVTIHAILDKCLLVSIDKRNRGVEMRVSGVLKRNGWERYNACLDGGDRKWRYRKVGIVGTVGT